MLNAVLSRFKLSIRITIKGAISAFLVVLSVALPQIAHVFGGASAGAIYLPMYAPALLAGCLLGWQWGLGIGILSPIVSFGFTTLALGSPMPTVERLPYMILELAAFGGISGLFAKKIENNAYLSFPAVILSQLCGRAVYVIYNLIAGREFSYLLTSVQTGLVGLYIQAVTVPVIVILLSKLLKRYENE